MNKCTFQFPGRDQQWELSPISTEFLSDTMAEMYAMTVSPYLLLPLRTLKEGNAERAKRNAWWGA
jgi:hypothetical protein